MCLLTAYFLLPSTAHAEATQQQSQALSVSPAILEVVADAGKPFTTVVTVTNITNVPLPIKGSVKNFTPNEDIPQDPNGIFQAQNWFKIAEPDFILQPQERRKITVTISPPSKASPGGHYATIYF